MIIIKTVFFLFSILFCQNIKNSLPTLEDDIYNKDYQEQLNKKRIFDLERKIFGAPSYKIEREDNDYIFFLKNEARLKLVGKNYNLIKAELDKMLNDYNKQIDTVDIWKIKFKERVWVDEKLMTYVYIEKEKNKVLKQNKLLKVLKPELKDFISFLGGYSELANRNYDLDKKSIFEVKVMLEEFELTGPSKCTAKIKFIGKEDVLKFYNINDEITNYQGSYTINWDKNYINLFSGGKIWMDIRFDKQKYLSKEYKVFLKQSILPSSEKYSNTIKVMFDELIPFSALANNIPKYRELRFQYLNKFEKNISINEIQNFTYEDWIQELIVLDSEMEKQKEILRKSNEKKRLQEKRKERLLLKEKEDQKLKDQKRITNNETFLTAGSCCFRSCAYFLPLFLLYKYAEGLE